LGPTESALADELVAEPGPHARGEGAKRIESSSAAW